MIALTSPDNALSTIRSLMAQGDVDEAARMLVHFWSTLPVNDRPEQVLRLHSATSELADRFPLSESVSSVLYHATFAYAQVDDFHTATAGAWWS